MVLRAWDRPLLIPFVSRQSQRQYAVSSNLRNLSMNLIPKERCICSLPNMRYMLGFVSSCAAPVDLGLSKGPRTSISPQGCSSVTQHNRAPLFRITALATRMRQTKQLMLLQFGITFFCHFTCQCFVISKQPMNEITNHITNRLRAVFIDLTAEHEIAKQCFKTIARIKSLLDRSITESAKGSPEFGELLACTPQLILKQGAARF